MEFYDLDNSHKIALNEIDDTSFIEEYNVNTGNINGKKFVLWGHNNRLPYQLIKLVANDEVTSQAKHFNILTCFGSGIEYKDFDSQQRTKNTDVINFMQDNALQQFFLEQCTDMKYFFFSIAIIILNRAGNKIISIRHKDACNVRFQKANDNGVIENIFYANFDKNGSLSNAQTIPLLDEHNPLLDLKIRLGMAPDISGRMQKKTNQRKFAVLSKFPTPGNPYYPQPYYTSIFRSGWFTIKQLIANSKMAKIKNFSAIRYLVEINRDYWDRLCNSEQITDPEKRKLRIIKEKENIRDFVSGIKNNSKMWFSSMYIDPTGKEISDVRITSIDTNKAGGDWSEDIQEAANMICFAEGIHPNLVGAVPGKTQTNNSGSDKRELFTLKQALEIAYHNVLLIPHNLVINFNHWNIYPDVPMITLTTLDNHADAVKQTTIQPEQVNS